MRKQYIEIKKKAKRNGWTMGKIPGLSPTFINGVHSGYTQTYYLISDGTSQLSTDGWDRKGDFNADWDKEISFDDFWNKAGHSTTCGPRMDYDELKAMVFDKIYRGEIPKQ